MDTAKTFMSGRSQAVRLPRAYRFEGAEVRIRREGRAVLLEPLPEDWAWLDRLEPLSEDFMAGGREQPAPQTRGALDGE